MKSIQELSEKIDGALLEDRIKQLEAQVLALGGTLEE